MMLCEQFGHEIVALGNLLPLDGRQGDDDARDARDAVPQDIDSYMYQTVG
eukprot:CAMPEP_0198246302 /NCGR_PEP_ID=MMETSP1446-20131203/45907_1 /TAXON_ID=1461542 ORGANISM="Unidentified sp, Strain CCMP2111" /NCGR_SAMPLE_ID=MMETSP1446 /ASSEMBLY_ACC=CAM_ASM_001112 /LENGTH=49 /DNA_ID= /DNA_START= /DNA_END= /DNA_ORIENTATION=